MKLQSEFEDRSRWAEELTRQLEERDQAQLKLQTEFEDRNRWAEELSGRLEERDQAQLKLQSGNRWAEELTRQLEERDEAQLKLQSEFEDWAEEKPTGRKRPGQLKLQTEFEDRNRWAEELSRQLEARDEGAVEAPV